MCVACSCSCKCPCQDHQLASGADIYQALQLRGYLARPAVEITQLHNIFAVEMETIERMGAVSLPATYAGAAL